MEWNAETEIFIIIVYIVVPTLLVGGIFMGLIWFIRELIKSWGNRDK